jgi:octaprenyl-diphosphate synthase
MSVNQIIELVQDELTAMNDVIFNIIQSYDGLINDVSQYIIQAGGKRLRPLLTLLASNAMGYQGQDHIKLAAMIEFLHTATLLHDDVIDESSLRRGKKTAHYIWGNKASILVGDFLFTQYMQLMLDVGDLKIIKHMTDIAREVTIGEIKQLNNEGNSNMTVNAYLDIIKAKTSLLFATSCKIGAMLSHVDHAIEDKMHTFGLHFGNAFQLTDDALDYASNSQIIGKNIGTDLANGKTTLPLIHALNYGSSTQKQLIQRSITEQSIEDLSEVIRAIDETGAITYTKNLAKTEIDLALQALDTLPNSIYKDAMHKLALYVVERES